MSEPEYVTLQLDMWNEHHQYFTDSFSVGFNVKFYRTIKVYVCRLVPLRLIGQCVCVCASPSSNHIIVGVGVAILINGCYISSYSKS
jgi:hypothetical protein